jgi:glycosyltransferase involved in cell wall biosynthesis
MKFSFIIPALNEEKYIGGCIRSIKSQLEEGDEIIVVDNGSHDRTPQIAKRLGCRVLKEKNNGLSHARNRGAREAKGDVLCFIDADSIVSDEWLSRAKATLRRTKHKAVAGQNVFAHDSLSKFCLYNTYSIAAFFLMLFLKAGGHIFLAGNNLAIKKNLFYELGGFEPYIAEDYWLSKKYWSMENSNGAFDPRMLIYLSSRGFDSAGYFKTISLWLRCTIFKKSQKNYSFKNKSLS